MAELSSKREMPVSSTSPERARSGRKAIWVPVALVALLLGGVSYWQSTSAAQGGEAAEEEPAVVVSVGVDVQDAAPMCPERTRECGNARLVATLADVGHGLEHYVIRAHGRRLRTRR